MPSEDHSPSSPLASRSMLSRSLRNTSASPCLRRSTPRAAATRARDSGAKYQNHTCASRTSPCACSSACSAAMRPSTLTLLASSIFSKYRVCISSVMVTGGRATNATKSPNRYSPTEAVILGVLCGCHLDSMDTMPPERGLGGRRGSSSSARRWISMPGAGGGSSCASIAVLLVLHYYRSVRGARAVGDLEELLNTAKQGCEQRVPSKAGGLFFSLALNRTMMRFGL
mmetsp:Transcript_3697/g.8861  ORF Transcript_3697/g.8861 Transcript_3697/m.8861 type:complete len:227 (+) Transcript_3697:433-1113(+)